jgi:hypothetical protein
MDGTGTGFFTSSLYGLTAGTLYYVRAYATNTTGTAYGDELTFSTLQLSAPTVITYEAIPVSASTATCGGYVLSDGGTPVTARGVCWNTSPNPTTANYLTSDGNGTGGFISTLTGLSPNTTYYVRAYAINSVGTSYGAEVMFNNTYWIGENYGGGIIFYLDGTWQHGLITSATDLSVGAPWGCPGNFMGSTSYAIGSGQDNTTAIVNGCSTPGIAARICDALVLNGYSDWFLPSADELYELVSQGAYIGGIVDNEPYWSSTEIDQAGAIAMIWWEYEWKTKETPGHVRAVRSF